MRRGVGRGPLTLKADTDTDKHELKQHSFFAHLGDCSVIDG
jgi:hypothetical protein